MTPTPEYWESLKTFQEGVPQGDSNANKQTYLLKNTGTQNFSVANTAKRFQHLLQISGLFKHFIESKAAKDPRFKSVLDILNEKKDGSSSGKQDHKDARHRKSEREEDAELLREEEDDEDGDDSIATTSREFQFTESPAYIDGKLRPYQVQGLNWMVALHKSGLAGILADEMGLGKTLQTISFLGYLRYIEKVRGPFLVIAPKSTLNNWLREIRKWTPEVNAFILQGDKEERAQLVANTLMECKFDICVASYEIIIREKAAFRKFDWQYIVIDEAHRIKNEESMLSQVLREFSSRNRLLITGTPLQNNLHELWALLNFLLPDIFSDAEDFDDWFSTERTEEEKDKVVKQLHTVLQPFLLRRIKNEVETSLLPKQELNLYVGMSPMQKKWYRKILEKDLDAVNGANGNKESKTRLLNIVMQLRKCCNHPYLFDGAEPGPPYTTDEHLVFNSEKLLVLDKLLRRLKEEGSRVLIFSQMSRVLDILEDYCYLRQYNYCRIDGSTDHEDRIEAIDEYNAPDSDKFLFLLTTRAGGLGINLTSADIVVLFDSDWNPQADLQAMDRAHRIGQKKQVKVFRFVTDNSVEEKILERATQKLRLDQLVIQQGRPSAANKNKNDNKGALLSMIQHGAADLFNSASEPASGRGTPAPGGALSQAEKAHDVDLDALLMQSETKTHTLQSKYATLGLDDLQRFSQESAYEWNGENFKNKSQQRIGGGPGIWLNPAKRERKENYSVDGYYKDVLSGGGRSGSSGPAHTKLPRLHYFASHQLQQPALRVLYEKERMYAARQAGYRAVVEDLKTLLGDSYDDSETAEEKEARVKLLQLAIDNAQPLTEEEEELKNTWEAEGFTNWNKIEFRKFITLSGKHGRHSIAAIAAEMSATKTLEEVRDFAASFWSLCQDVDDYEKYLHAVQVEEERVRHAKFQQEALRRKLSRCLDPLRELSLDHPPSKAYSGEQDRFLLLMLFKHGVDREDVHDVIREEVRRSPLFDLDFAFRSKSAAELGRRCASLLQSVEREFHDTLELDEDVEKRLKEEDATGKRVRAELVHESKRRRVEEANEAK